ncbi:MAG: histidine kinase, partial [Planctomycetes bacterium]|nr:histidine kinase [Planctomycetota bacterium]
TFTPRAGAISLRVEHGGDASVRLIVADTGPGIDESKKEAIFEKFHQLDASQTREYEGTGLGLAITRELVHVLGGTISLEASDGRGAIFLVTLPVETATPPERALFSLA